MPTQQANTVRLEKKLDEKKRLYIEFRAESRNSVLRLWNHYGADGRPVQKKERENFQSESEARGYIKNQVAAYLKQGYIDTANPSKDVKTGAEGSKSSGTADGTTTDADLT